MPEEVQSVAVRLIEPSPYQPRRRFNEEGLDELAASIRRHGIIQPVIVRPVGSHFQLIAGERRLRAAEKLGLVEIPAIVRECTDRQALEAALVENLQREDISVIEAARAYQRLASEFHYTQAEIAERTGKSRAAINNTLRLLQLPEPVLEMLHRAELAEGHGRALLALPYPSLQTELAGWIVRNAVPVRDTERKVRALLQQHDPGAAAPGKEGKEGKDRKTPSGRNAYLLALEERLRQHFGTRAVLSYRQGRGTVSLEFYSDEDLCRLLELMGLHEL